MTASYEILNQLPEGTHDFEIVTTFKGFPKSNRRSGHTPPGDTVLETVSMTIEPKTKKAGRNIHLECRVVADGVIIHKYLPAPVDDTDNDAGYRMWRQYVESVLSYNGMLDSNIGRTTAVKSADLVGKQFAARVVDGEAEYANTSGIDRFLSKEEFEASQKKPVDNTRTNLSTGNGQDQTTKESVSRALFQ